MEPPVEVPPVEHPEPHAGMGNPVADQMNPMFQQFLQFQQFQQFQAMIQAQPMPQLAVGPPPPQLGRPPVDPGMMVAMSQVRPPTLEGLKVSQIKAFRLAYRRYASKCPVPQWVRLPGQLTLPEQLVTIATFNNVNDIEELKTLEEEEFFHVACRMYNATMVTQYCRILESVKMTTSTWSLELYLEYVEDFKFQMMVAGFYFKPPESELVKIFVSGLQPRSLQNEIRRKNLQTLEAAIEEIGDTIVRLKAIFDLQDSLVRSSQKKGSSDKKSHTKVEDKDDPVDTPPVVVTYTKKPKETPRTKKTGSTVTCYKCLQKGHLAPNCPNPKHPRSTWQPKTVRAVKKSDEPEEDTEVPVARSVRVFAADLPSTTDSFIRLDVSLIAPAEETTLSPTQFRTLWIRELILIP